MPKKKVKNQEDYTRKGKIKTNRGKEIELDLKVKKTFYEDGSNDIEISLPKLNIIGDKV